MIGGASVDAIPVQAKMLPALPLIKKNATLAVLPNEFSIIQMN
jgi:hypothetical protein